MVVTDANGDDVYVVMGLEQYEQLVDAEDEFDPDFNPDDFLDESHYRHDDDSDDFGPGWWDDYTGGDKPPEPPSAPESIPQTIRPLEPTTPPVPTSPPTDIWEAMQPAGETGETWDMNKMSEAEKSDLARQFEEYQKDKNEDRNSKFEGNLKEDTKIEEIKEKEEKEDEDFGEEQFYLEPIE